VLADAFERDQGTLLYRTRKFWFAAAVGVPAALSLLALLAYYYTALQLELRLEQSVGLTLLLVLVNGLLLRWLFVTRRRLAVEQARTRSASDAASSGDRVSESGVKVLDEDRVDIPAVDSQTRQLFRSGITLSALVGLYLIWASALPALGGLERIQVWPTVAITEVETDLLLESFSAGIPPAARNGATGAPSGAAAEQTGERGASGGDGGAASNSSGGLIGGSSGGRPGGSGGGGSSASSDASGSEQGAAASGSGSQTIITLADVALTAIVLLVVTIAAKNIPGLLEISLLQRLPLDSGARFAVTTLVRYLILVAGISAAFGTLGVSWEKVQWLAAALTFGLAFGLQEIFANFVSGIIILLERPVRIGDIVTVAGTEGRVTRLAMRATTIMDWDRRELLVPNKEFITGSIVNWTLSDQITRLRLDVGVAYGSDVDRARQLMLRAAKENRDLLDDPPPRAWFLGFGDSALSLRLLAFLPTRDVYLSAMDRLHSDIDRLFREAGIEISFPQRDLHLRSAPGLEQLWARQGRRFGTDAADEPADEPAEEAADDRDRPPPKPGPSPG
jgi:potassium efflux system protein